MLRLSCRQGGVDTLCRHSPGAVPRKSWRHMQAFRAGQKPATVMDRIAKGFTDAEVQAIADWYAQRK